MLSFKQRHFKQEMILMLIRWYVAYALSYRDIEELAAERGLNVDHSTINRWVIHYAPQLEASFRKRCKRPMGSRLDFCSFYYAFMKILSIANSNTIAL